MAANRTGTASFELTRSPMSWIDVAAGDPDRIREFYTEVVGWSANGGADSAPPAEPGFGPEGDGPPEPGFYPHGIDAGLPPRWLVYITVDDVDWSAARCVQLGGEVVVNPRRVGVGRFCVIRDPAGAVCSLFSLTY